MACCDNIIIPVNPCSGSIPCRRYTSTDCVIHNGTLACGTLGTNPKQTTVNAYFCSALLNLQSQIDEIIDNPFPCYTFTAFPFFEGGDEWENWGSGYQNAGYSNVQSCIVRLVGYIKAVDKNVLAGGTISLIGTLPVGYRPFAIREFSVNVKIVQGGTDAAVLSGQLSITSVGAVTIAFTNDSGITGVVDVSVNLDGVNFETNDLGI